MPRSKIQCGSHNVSAVNDLDDDESIIIGPMVTNSIQSPPRRTLVLPISPNKPEIEFNASSLDMSSENIRN